jgi:hypothetical protein
MKRFLGTLALAILLSGCAAPKFAVSPYHANPDRFGAIHLVASNKLCLSPVIERLDEDNRRFIDPKFSTSAYLTDALDQELTAAGVRPVRTPFAVGPGFDAARQAIAAQANKSEAAVYLVSEVRWFGPVKLTLDAKLFSPSGSVLFEKRGLCLMLNAQAGSQTVAYMALRQIIADPAFQKALQ